MNSSNMKSLNRIDKSDKKRVELHLHTKMSPMDALISPEEAIKTAKEWGHSAIAITDHGGVHAFPDAMRAAEKVGMKVIYGMEAYMVNDSENLVHGNEVVAFSDECVVFDIETSGLNRATAKIIAIGAVKIKEGKVVDRYYSLINPKCPIPAQVEELTSICNEELKKERTIETVLPEFLDFIGSRVLFAHNADYCMGFLIYEANMLALKLNNTYVDLVSMSKYLNRSLKNHRIDTLLEHYHLNDIKRQTAEESAEASAMILSKMMGELSQQGIKTLDTIKSIAVDPLKAKTYHHTILVKNNEGLKNLYRLVTKSRLNYFSRVPRTPKSELAKHRDGLLFGSACDSGELYEALIENRNEADIGKIVEFYDFLEIQPISIERWRIDAGMVVDDEELKNINRRIVALGEKYKKPVVATSDAHFINPEDELARRIYLNAQHFIATDRECPLYLRTTEEMLREFSYLGEEKAYEVVVENTNKINSMIEEVRPLPNRSFYPYLDGAEKELRNICNKRLRELYGEKPHKTVQDRMNAELSIILNKESSTVYMIAKRMVDKSESMGYRTGSRGGLGASFVAFLAGITDINPLPAHYVCPNCHHTDFPTYELGGLGCDLPQAVCPVCKTTLDTYGYDIPYETFLGFWGDRFPDIDLNFASEIQGEIKNVAKELFGEDKVFAAGTIGTLPEKSAYRLVKKYFEERNVSISNEEMRSLINKCVGVLRATGEHPGGIIVVDQNSDIHDFTPLQYSGDDPKFGKIATHFSFSYLHEMLLKIDVLGHSLLSKFKQLEEITGESIDDVPINDKDVFNLFEKGDTLGINEFGTPFVKNILNMTNPKTFLDLLKISGLTHGTDTWHDNAENLIRDNTCLLTDVISLRDDIMLYLIDKGLDKQTAFIIMEHVRKGKGLATEHEETMRLYNVPEWYIDSCKKIKYLFPKSHAVSYVMSAIRLAWYKVNTPLAFYCASFTDYADCFKAEIILEGMSAIDLELAKEKAHKERPWWDYSLNALELAKECGERGIMFLPPDFDKSHKTYFMPEDGAIRMPLSVLKNKSIKGM